MRYQRRIDEQGADTQEDIPEEPHPVGRNKLQYIRGGDTQENIEYLLPDRTEHRVVRIDQGGGRREQGDNRHYDECQENHPEGRVYIFEV